MSTRLHCNGCSHDYDTILPEDELDAAVCPRCGSFGSSVPADQEAMTETLEEAFTSPPPVAPVAESRPVEKQLEAPREKHEGQQGTHPRETRVAGNVEGRFPRQVTRKGLLIAGGILVLLIIAGGITWTIVRSPGSSSTEGGVDVVIEKEAPQAPEKKPEEEKQVSQAPQKPAPAPAPVQKKTPAKTPKVQTPREPWNIAWKPRHHRQHHPGHRHPRHRPGAT